MEHAVHFDVSIYAKRLHPKWPEGTPVHYILPKVDFNRTIKDMKGFEYEVAIPITQLQGVVRQVTRRVAKAGVRIVKESIKLKGFN
mmetsp:Transcript_10387/g.13585  ORF Transcript_10387/g.13585 Transcript_10387/m.13585 type:complete len:86 (-) Transcript_10387:64-321(-)